MRMVNTSRGKQFSAVHALNAGTVLEKGNILQSGKGGKLDVNHHFAFRPLS